MENDGGRPTSVYGIFRPRAFEHDVLGTTEFAIGYQDAEWIRGNDLERGSDGIMFLGGEKFYVEMDYSGKMELARIRRRWKSYQDSDAKLLVVARSERRRQEIVEASGAVGDIALFGVLWQCVANPRGAIWQDIRGDAYSV